MPDFDRKQRVAMVIFLLLLAVYVILDDSLLHTLDLSFRDIKKSVAAFLYDTYMTVAQWFGASREEAHKQAKFLYRLVRP